MSSTLVMGEDAQPPGKSISIVVVNSDNSRSALPPEEVEDVLRGVMYAVVSITDDTEYFVAYGKKNPWHLEAVKLVTGSEERANAKLSDILKEDLGLNLDHFFDCSKVAPGGHFIDTQGYIAHNDSTIVLSYRCTTTRSDWLANLTTTKSAWEVEHDMKKGHSGRFSGITDSFKKRTMPFVHTGFYNNFLASVPAIIEHIKPLLEPNQPPRKLLVTGHSLGAGIATLATCYFLTEFPWKTLPHSLVSVTLGGPRACHQSMIDSLNELSWDELKNVAIYRLVNGKDLVTKIPPKILGFEHLGRKVLIITEDSSDIKSARDLDLDDDDNQSVDASQVGKLLNRGFNDEGASESFSRSSSAGIASAGAKTYQEKVARLPRSVRDHMPDNYLKPLLFVRGIKHGSIRGEDNNTPVVSISATLIDI